MKKENEMRFFEVNKKKEKKPGKATPYILAYLWSLAILTVIFINLDMLKTGMPLLILFIAHGILYGFAAFFITRLIKEHKKKPSFMARDDEDDEEDDEDEDFTSKKKEKGTKDFDDDFDDDDEDY